MLRQPGSRTRCQLGSTWSPARAHVLHLPPFVHYLSSPSGLIIMIALVYRFSFTVEHLSIVPIARVTLVRTLTGTIRYSLHAVVLRDSMSSSSQVNKPSFVHAAQLTEILASSQDSLHALVLSLNNGLQHSADATLRVDPVVTHHDGLHGNQL